MKHKASPTRREQASPTSAARGDRKAAIEFRRAVDLWISDGKARGWSARTVGNRRHQMEKFVWWLQHDEEAVPTLAAFTADRVRRYIVYLREANPTGRYGSDAPNAKRASRPSSVDTVYRALKALCSFLLDEGLLAENPLGTVKRPRVPRDQITPLSEEEIQRLLDAARRGRNPEPMLA